MLTRACSLRVDFTNICTLHNLLYVKLRSASVFFMNVFLLNNYIQVLFITLNSFISTFRVLLRSSKVSWTSMSVQPVSASTSCRRPSCRSSPCRPRSRRARPTTWYISFDSSLHVFDMFTWVRCLLTFCLQKLQEKLNEMERELRSIRQAAQSQERTIQGLTDSNSTKDREVIACCTFTVTLIRWDNTKLLIYVAERFRSCTS